jgi:hypothetical protein
MPHNESLAEQAAEHASANGNGVFDDGETGVEFSKDENGLKFGIRLSNKQLFAGLALIVGATVLKRAVDPKSLVSKSASKVQDVAEQAEEAANRG